MMVSNFVKENARDEVIAEQRNTSTQHRGIGEDRVHKQLDPGRATVKGGMVGPEQARTRTRPMTLQLATAKSGVLSQDDLADPAQISRIGRLDKSANDFPNSLHFRAIASGFD